jgi:hypothetical protein
VKTLPLRETPARWEWGLLLAVFAFYAVCLPLHGAWVEPGFVLYDEEDPLNKLQAWREGSPLLIQFAAGSLHRLLIAGPLALFGPSLTWFRLPATLAVLAEPNLLYHWLKPKAGARAALWACLAQLICTASFARGRCLIAASLLPALFLAHLLAAERLRRPWQAALWAFSAALWSLDYEGWIGALLFLLPYAAWLWRRERGLVLGAVAGGLLGLAALQGASGGLGDYFRARQAISGPSAGPGLLLQVWENLRDLLGPGHRLAFAAAPGHPLPAPWTWLLILTGLVAALRAWPPLAALLAIGALPMALRQTAMEPQRLSLLFLGCAIAAGFGAASLGRRRWGPALCAGLALAGIAHEGAAWLTADPLKHALAYGHSHDLRAAVQALKAAEPPEGWELIDQLGPYQDGAFRLMADAAGLRRSDQGRPVALVHWDYLPALKGLKGEVREIRGDGALRPLYLYFPDRATADRLCLVRASLQPWRRNKGRAQELQARLESLLRDPGFKDPWARSIAWDAWMSYNRQLNRLDPGLYQRMVHEPLVSAFALDVAAEKLEQRDPSLGAKLRAKAEALDPRLKTLPLRGLHY